MKAFISLTVFLLCLLSCRVFCDEEDMSARLFLYKSTKTEPVVEGKDFVVTYKLINNGDAGATSIEIVDRYDPTSFEMTENVSEEGNVGFQLEELAPGAQHVFNVTVRPKLYGIYESTRARIKYNSGLPALDDAEEDIRSGSSSSLGRTRIISLAEHLRNTSYYIKEWATFSIGFAIAILPPLFNWISARAAYSSATGKAKLA